MGTWRSGRTLLLVPVLSVLWQNVLFAQGRPQALLGPELGVARITVPQPAVGVGPGDIRIVEADGRILYPAVTMGRGGEVLSQVLGEQVVDVPPRLQISFLFTGDQPLTLTIFTPQPQEVRLHPAHPRRPRDFDRAFQRWWKDFHTVVRVQHANSDYPPFVETYLTSMLAGRFGLRPPLLTRMQQTERSELENIAGLLLGVEDLRFSVMHETMQGGGGLGETASIPVPPDITWQETVLPAGLPQVDIEPIAMHVPQECFYIRFGSFENYLWFDHLQDDYGGNIGQMVTRRGHNAGLDQKLQQQLGLRQSALAEVMGPQVISDVALIGRDLYLQDGAAMGVLFEAKNSALLRTNFTSDRLAVLQEWKARGATLETVPIDGHDVSLLSCPDNRLRSYYVEDGPYHLVTTSRTIAQRFLEAGKGAGTLGASAEFQHARWRMPLDREDTIFAYFSSAFFRGLLSPQYQIELIRRLQSVTDMELLQLAQLAASGERQPAESVDVLIAGGFLPQRFGQRGDGRAPLQTDHGFVDSLRGARGYFAPIPDIPLQAITPSESALYNRAAQSLVTGWPQMDPLMAGIKRFALEPERMERIVIDANVSPIAEEKYGWVLSMVGPPTEVQIQSDPSDVLTMQMSLKGGLLWPAIPAHQVFLGIEDLEPSLNPVPDGFLRTLNILRTTPGYLGAWPQLGLLDLLPFLSTQPDVFGFSELPFGLWRWQGGGFSVLSFHQPVLAEVAESLTVLPTENPAQIQIRIGDLAHSRLARWISLMSYERSRQVSRGNVRLLNALQQQFHVSPPETLDLANRLLDTQLVCALGGEYEYVDSSDGTGHWRSTAWPEPGGPPPDDTAPLLEWFRGGEVDLTCQEDGLFVHAKIDMHRKEREPAVKLPLFDLFGTKPQPTDDKR